MAARQQMGSELQMWRTRVLNVLLVVVSVAATWRIGLSIIQAIREPQWWPATVPYLLVYAIVITLTVARRLDHRVRAWGLILIGYGLSAMTLAMFGLLGNGLVYLLALPLIGMFLLGPRSGLAMTGLSLAILATFTGLAHQGALDEWLVLRDNTTALSDWLGVDTMFAGLLIMSVVMAWLFSRAQAQAVVREHQAAGALAAAHAEVEARAGQLDRYARLMEGAAAIARETTSLLERDRLLQRTAALVASRLALDMVAVYLPGRPGAPFELSTAAGPLAEQAAASPPGSAARAVRLGRPEAEQSTEENTVWQELGLPLRIAGQPTGALYVRTSRAEPLSQQESSVLQVMADQLAVALENSRLFAETQASLHELASLYRQYTAGAWQRFTAAGKRTAAWQSEAEPLEPQTWQELFAQARASGLPTQAQAGGRQLLAVPIRLRDLPIGVLGLHHPADAGPWQAEQVSAIEAVAERLALATENLRLLEESQRRAAREQWLGQMGERMQRSADLGTLLRVAAEELDHAFGAAHTLVQFRSEADLSGDRADGKQDRS